MDTIPLNFTKKSRTARPKKVIDAHNEITKIAHRLYEQRGYKDGHDFDDWVEAEELYYSIKRTGVTFA